MNDTPVAMVQFIKGSNLQQLLRMTVTSGCKIAIEKCMERRKSARLQQMADIKLKESYWHLKIDSLYL
jgi:hypothetical protein